MQANHEMIINTPPALTMSWLKAGGVSVKDFRIAEKAACREERPQELTTLSASPFFADFFGGAGEDLARTLFTTESGVQAYRLPAGIKAGEAHRLFIELKDKAVGRWDYVLEKDSELVLVMDICSEEAGLAALLTRIRLEAGARLTLVQLHRQEAGFLLIDDLALSLGEGALCRLIRLDLNAGPLYEGCKAQLEGATSAFESQLAYRLEKGQKLDMNYEIIHQGPRSRSDIKAAGVLARGAEKIFRGTIDLRRGCTGAEGTEMEDVLLMDDTVRNRTLPVILCTEEDVSGNHGATIGRLDESLLFYLESRGMEREAIYDMMARARMEHVIRMIPDEKTLQRLFPELQEEQHD